MKRLIASAIAVAAVAGVAPALASNAVTGAGSSAAHGKSMEAPTRAALTQKVQRHFERIDANRDGFVTQAELDAAGERRRAHWQQRRHSRGAAMFERLDANKDGNVTRAEAEPVFESRQVDIAHSGPGDRQPRRNWDALVTRFDSNKDGAISRAEFDAGHAERAAKHADRPAHHGLPGRIFQSADADRDGRVSLAEATAAATAHFDAADTNRDGTLSREERMQARKAIHAKGGDR